MQECGDEGAIDGPIRDRLGVLLHAVSDIKNVTVEEVRETVLANTLRLYPDILS